MGRRNRRGTAGPSGWLIIDKPEGPTSHDVVRHLRRCLGTPRVGHAGTLDPLATGVLPIAVGEATKTVAHIVNGEKTYRFMVAWGTARDTDDAEGRIVAESAGRPGAAAIRAALPGFIGEIEQVPPSYSAIKIDGKRAYALARAGKEPEMRPRIVTVHDFRLEAIEGPDRAVFTARTGKGVYIRSLARDLARHLGTVGHVARLRRLRDGPFSVDQAVKLAEISLESGNALGHSAAALEHLLPVETALDDIPALAMTEAEARLIKNGQPVPLLKKSDLERIGAIGPGDMVRAKQGERLIALARFDKGQLRSVRGFNLSE